MKIFFTAFTDLSLPPPRFQVYEWNIFRKFVIHFLAQEATHAAEFSPFYSKEKMSKFGWETHFLKPFQTPIFTPFGDSIWDLGKEFPKENFHDFRGVLIDFSSQTNFNI